MQKIKTPITQPNRESHNIATKQKTPCPNGTVTLHIICRQCGLWMQHSILTINANVPVKTSDKNYCKWADTIDKLLEWQHVMQFCITSINNGNSKTNMFNKVLILTYNFTVKITALSFNYKHSVSQRHYELLISMKIIYQNYLNFFQKNSYSAHCWL